MCDINDYGQRATDIYNLIKACELGPGEAKNCYAVRRDLMAVIKSHWDFYQNGWEQFCNLVNADPDFKVRCVMPSKTMVKASLPFRGSSEDPRVMIDGMSKWAHVDH